MKNAYEEWLSGLSEGERYGLATVEGPIFFRKELMAFNARLVYPNGDFFIPISGSFERMHPDGAYFISGNLFGLSINTIATNL